MGPSPPLPSPSAPHGMYELTEGVWAAALIGIETFLSAHPEFSFVYNGFYLPATGEVFHAASGILATVFSPVGRSDLT